MNGIHSNKVYLNIIKLSLEKKDKRSKTGIHILKQYWLMFITISFRMASANLFISNEY